MLSLFPPPGPSLSPFSSLLVKGSYHSSALIHLAIGHVLQSSKHEALILSPSQSTFKQKLKSGLDEWLSRSVNTNRMRAAMSRIIIAYPPSPAHFSLLVATLDGTQSAPELTHLWGCLAVSPTENLSLVILDGISTYSANTDLVSAESLFISLMNRLRQSICRIAAIRAASNPISIACFEAALFHSEHTQDQPHSPPMHLESVISDFFSLIIHFYEIEASQDIPSSQRDNAMPVLSGEKRTRKCISTSMTGENGNEHTSIEYTESLIPGTNSPPSLHFCWQ